jgi:long-chain acyl-CoA synthetase
MQVLSLPVLNGWGLTETSPVLACRRSVPQRENVRGTVGLPIPGTQIRVVDPETLAPLAEGEKVRAVQSLPPSRACIVKD